LYNRKEDKLIVKTYFHYVHIQVNSASLDYHQMVNFLGVSIRNSRWLISCNINLTEDFIN